jgi:uncharacterized membrane protein
MISSTKMRGSWPLPALLIALSVIPVVAGAFRVTELAGGAQITPENARFFAAPAPVVLHILSASLFCVLGAVQFAPGFRQRRPTWHRASGRVLILCGVAAGLSGLWLTQFYPHVEGDGDVLYGLRLLVGSAIVVCMILGFAAVRRRNIEQHRAWVTRGYALGMGAGTQALLHLPWLVVGKPGEFTRTLLMGGGWIINLAVAEWSLRRSSALPIRHPATA